MADDDFQYAGADLAATFDSLGVQTRGLESGAASFARAITQAFSRAVIDGKRFEDVLKSLVLRLSDMSVRLAFKPLEQGLATGIERLFAGLTGGGGATQASGTGHGGGGLLGGLLSLFGGATPFADGGVIAAPTYFPLAPGRLGLAGEAGPEAILPLARGPDGRLGVAAAGQGAATQVTVNIVTPDPASFRHSEAYLSGIVARAVARGQRAL